MKAIKARNIKKRTNALRGALHEHVQTWASTSLHNASAFEVIKVTGRQSH